MAEVHLLGMKGGPAIRPGSNMPTSILVRLAGKTLLIDAGLGVSRAVCDAGVPLTGLDAIIVTHLHSDHYLELGPLLHTAWTAGLARRVPVYGPRGLDAYWDAFLRSMDADIALRIADEGRPPLADLVDVEVLSTSGGLSIDTVAVDAIRNDHPPLRDSFALRFRGEGKTVVLSGGTAFLPAMIEFAAGADLLVHEAMLARGVDEVIAKVGNGDARLKEHILRSHTEASDVG